MNQRSMGFVAPLTAGLQAGAGIDERLGMALVEPAVPYDKETGHPGFRRQY